MTSIDFKFEEIPLVLTNYSSPTPLAIALISGTAEITYSRVYGDDSAGLGAGFEFDIENITLSAPIAGWPDVPVKWARNGTPGRVVWDLVSRSIERACTNDIFAALAEENEPNADVQYDAMAGA